MWRSVGTFRGPRCFCHKRGRGECRRKEDAQTRGAGREDTGDKGTSRELQQSLLEARCWFFGKTRKADKTLMRRVQAGRGRIPREFCERFGADIVGNVENKRAGSWGST